MPALTMTFATSAGLTPGGSFRVTCAEMAPFANDAATAMSTLVCWAATADADAEKASANIGYDMMRTKSLHCGDAATMNHLFIGVNPLVALECCIVVGDSAEQCRVVALDSYYRRRRRR
jgi:hypothetical protein